ncbi:MAG: amino acid--tRNA ligase-related protein [Patescibacteria group bacterium]|nr:amino acid--tRNA ligase-related protein [Patescibacteria group bacterium]
MSRKSEKRRILALKKDLLAYRREMPKDIVMIGNINDFSENEKIKIAGRIVLADCSGKISKLGLFDNIGDQEVIILENISDNGEKIQAYLVKNKHNIEYMNQYIHYGDIVMLDGYKFKIEGKFAFLADDITLFSKAIGDIYDKNINFKKRSNVYSYRYIEMIRDVEKVKLFQSCSKVIQIIRQFLYNRGYNETCMSLLQESFEAGFANPFVTHVVEYDRDMYLRLTAELLFRKLMVAGFSSVFEISKSFRNQNTAGNMIPEFTIFELYKSYSSRDEMELLVKAIVCKILDGLYCELSIPIDDGFIDCSGYWEVFDFRDEVKSLTGMEYNEQLSVGELAKFLDKAGIKRPNAINKYTVATALYKNIVSLIEGPAFLRNLPAAQSPLFKLNEDGSTVDETLLVIKGSLIADIVNAERDPEIMRKRFEEQATYQAREAYIVNEDILQAMKFGLPPCRGIGMGIERLFMFLLNKKSIREVQIFPVF